MTQLSMLMLPPWPQILLIVSRNRQTVILSTAYLSHSHAYKAIHLLWQDNISGVIYTHSFPCFMPHFMYIFLHLYLALLYLDS